MFSNKKTIVLTLKTLYATVIPLGIVFDISSFK